MPVKKSVSAQDKVDGLDRALADSLSVGLFYTDIKGQCLYVNKKWLDISSLAFDDALGDGWVNAIHDDDRERVSLEWNESVKNDRLFLSEYRFQRDDETVVWVIGQANKYKDTNGNITGYVGTITDITERKNIESSLHQLTTGFSVASSSEFFRSFSIHLGEVLDIDYVVVSEIINDACDSVKSVVVNHRGEILDPIEYSLQGTPCETVIGKSVKGYKSGIQKAFPDFELLKALGAEGYVGTPLFDSSNNPIGIIAALDSKPIENIKIIEDVLQIYALRASAELERKQKEEELQKVNNELEFKQFTIEHMSESIFWVDIEAKFYDVNEAACQSLGYTRKELLQLSLPDIDPDVSLDIWKEHRREIKGGKATFESYHKTKDGRIFPVEISVNHIKFNGKDYFCSIVHDISERKENEFERETNLSLQTAIFEAAADGILVTDKDEHMTNYNQNFVKIWSLYDEEVENKKGKPILDLIIDKLKKPDVFISRTKEIYRKQEEDTLDIIELKDGRIIERVSHPQRLGREVVGRVWNFRDITEKHKLSEKLSYQANHDPLTGLTNRREFEKRLDRLLSSIDAKSTHVMCYMDLDNFKQVNDMFGHIAGDYFLKKISDLFQSLVRGRDTLARLGGDEFGLIMEYCSVVQAEKVANNFIKLINECELKWEDREFNVGVSIGIVKINNPRIGILEIMKSADIACYTAKKSGRNCIHISQD